MYDGLVRLTGGTGMPGFEPSLAAEMPTANADATVWTVKLRDGVTFSDGSTFDAADVVATYKAILDPASASEARSSYDMISDVVAVDDNTVEFRLAYSYAAPADENADRHGPVGIPRDTRTCRRIAVEHRACRYGSVHTRRSLTGSSGLRGERELLGRCTGDQEAHSPLRSGRQHPRPTYGVRPRSTEPISLHCLPIRSRAKTTCR